jgi:hypothetical protein
MTNYGYAKIIGKSIIEKTKKSGFCVVYSVLPLSPPQVSSLGFIELYFSELYRDVNIFGT